MGGVPLIREGFSARENAAFDDAAFLHLREF
jgi:hypothetical protein